MDMVNSDEAVACSPPPINIMKCNIGSSWVSPHINYDAMWILGGHNGEVSLHSRRSYLESSSPLDAELQSLVWALESLSHLRYNQVIIESLSKEMAEAIETPRGFPIYQHSFKEIHGFLNRF